MSQIVGIDRCDEIAMSKTIERSVFSEDTGAKVWSHLRMIVELGANEQW